MGYRIPGIFGTANQESEDGEAILFIHHALLLWETIISGLWTILALEEIFSKIKSHECRNNNNKRPFQKDNCRC